jgi:CRP-like cAMP-binding protein
MQQLGSGPRNASLNAWEASYFSVLPADIRNALLHDAFVVTVPAGHSIYEPFEPPRLALLHYGQARVTLMSSEGRAASLRYAGPGQVIGLPAVVSQGSPVGAQALTDSEMSMLNVVTLHRLGRTDARVGWLLAQQMSQIVFETVELLGENLFGSVQQRLCRHLLDLASHSPDGLVVALDQQELASTIGSVREVIARTLRKMREAGLVEKVPAGLRIIAPSELHAMAAGKLATSGDVR